MDSPWDQCESGSKLGGGRTTVCVWSGINELQSALFDVLKTQNNIVKLVTCHESIGVNSLFTMHQTLDWVECIMYMYTIMMCHKSQLWQPPVCYIGRLKQVRGCSSLVEGLEY